jgi:hypothetical protein
MDDIVAAPYVAECLHRSVCAVTSQVARLLALLAIWRNRSRKVAFESTLNTLHTNKQNLYTSAGETS